MKKILALCLSLIMLSACNEKNTDLKYEYRDVKVTGSQAEHGEFYEMYFSDQTEMLNGLGKDGWELVSTYTTIGTVHPNFGNEKFVTGLQANTRTSEIHFVFKRVLKEKK